MAIPRNQNKTINTQSGYDSWASEYDTTPNPMLTMVEHVLSQSLPLIRNKTIVELGCGTGRNFSHLFSAGATQIIGFDFSQNMLTQAKQRYPHKNIHLHQQDLTQKLPLASNSCDGIICTLVLEHISKLQPVFENAYDIVKSGGFFFVAEMHPFLFFQGSAAHFTDQQTNKTYYMNSYPHLVSDFVTLALQTGFTIQQCKEWSATPQLRKEQPKLEKYEHAPVLFSMVLEK